MAVNQEDVEAIVRVVPGFRTSWEKFLKERETQGSPPYYLAMSELAHYVVENYAQGITAGIQKDNRV